ncbi:MAG: hypothetical protein FWF96_04330 [Kiritimatiellaeota bacterium]|nr:hypothetical protein [Kiritimatiellota bacterium]
MKKQILSLLCLLATATVLIARENPFEMPARHEANARLRQQLNAAVQSKGHAAMEEATRQGVELLPENATWHYNHACALALLGDETRALKALEKSIALGFTDAAWIEADEDFISLRGKPAFLRLIETAREAKPAAAPSVEISTNDMTAVVSEENTLWDFDAAVFRAYFTFPDIGERAPGTYHGAEAALVRAWLEDGTAAGLYGVLYDNRCDGHSRLDNNHYPGLTRVVYGDEVKKRGLHQAQARFLYNATVIGNASVAHTEGPYWRSVARMITSDAHQHALLFHQYMTNHLYVYPCHVDYRQSQHGDVFVVNSPSVVVSLGSSGSDQVFLRALFSALSAFTPETQAFLMKSGRVAPTLNYLLRWTQKNFETKEDYYTGKAHRPVLDGANLDADAMTRLAHEMTTNAIPPLACVRLEAAPAAPRPGVGCFDFSNGELASMTPVACSMIMRCLEQKRVYRYSVSAPPPGVTETMSYRWEVLQATPGCVEIKPLNEDNTLVEITLTHPSTVPWREVPGNDDSMPTSRVDIGVFAHNGVHASPPAILSFYYLANESREYDEDGRLLKVDYANTAGRYTDPMYSLPKRWVDVYQYDATGVLLGWERQRGDAVEAFTADGFKVETRDDVGRPLTARVVEYLTRQGGAAELAQADTNRTVAYVYDGPDDKRGTFNQQGE